MSGYLIYHPKRQESVIDGVVIHHDRTIGNQDPYVWNRCFLHTFCHMAQMSPQVGQINFWVSGDTFPNFSRLFCDLVFVVEQKIYWNDANEISRKDRLVDSRNAYYDHYYPGVMSHPYKRRRRFTLKADPRRSFQPQDEEQLLIDIVPFLLDHGFAISTLREVLIAARGSRPMFLPNEISDDLYQWMNERSNIKLTGDILEGIRLRTPSLASPIQKIVSCK